MNPRNLMLMVCFVMVLTFAHGVAVAQGTTPPPNLLNPKQLEASFAALTQLFVLAVLLENAFALLFNWRVFLAYFSLRGVRSIIMVVVAYLVVTQFHLDIVASLIAVYRSTPEATVSPSSEFLSTLITSLIVAGGSAGVNNVLSALGYRTDRSQAEQSPQPPNDQAWISLRVQRKAAVGPIWVQVVEVNEPPIATISGTVGTDAPRLRELLLRNRDRFPANGGYVVKPGVTYKITVESRTSSSFVVTASVGSYAFTPRAVVDFEVTI
jgi:hypothetical protein